MHLLSKPLVSGSAFSLRCLSPNIDGAYQALGYRASSFGTTRTRDTAPWWEALMGHDVRSDDYIWQD